MKTSLDYKKLLSLATSYGTKYRIPITAAVLLAIFGFAVYRINSLSDPRANEAALLETLETYREVKIDDATVQNIKALTESNVEVNPQFDNRDNPFAESE